MVFTQELRLPLMNMHVRLDLALATGVFLHFTSPPQTHFLPIIWRRSLRRFEKVSRVSNCGGFYFFSLKDDKRHPHLLLFTVSHLLVSFYKYSLGHLTQRQMGEFKENTLWKEEKCSGLHLCAGAIAGGPISSAASREWTDGKWSSKSSSESRFPLFEKWLLFCSYCELCVLLRMQSTGWKLFPNIHKTGHWI